MSSPGNLTLQDKLALAMTTAGSQRNLASLLGITHQKLGRWLREGQPNGAKSIPTDSAAVKAINQAFHIHATVSKEQAQIDNIPFDQNAPVFAHRKPLRNGAPGDRVIVDHTQYMTRELRTNVLSHIHKTKRYYAVSVRSTIELARYFKSGEGKLRGKIRTDAQDIGRQEIVNKLEAGQIVGPIYTKYESFGPLSATSNALKGVEQKIREKHEPATGEKGTALADQLLMQLIPADYFERKKAIKQRARKARRKPKAF
jgi:hypothetical protein